MEKKLFEQGWTGLRLFFRRVADGVAQLTTWQFILLCLLGLVGAGILESIIGSNHGIRHRGPVTVSVTKEVPKTPDAASTPPGNADPGMPEKEDPAEDELEKTIKQRILKEIRKEIDKESGAAGASSANSKKSVNVRIGGLDLDDMAERRDRRGVPLAQIAFFLIIILLAVRITTRSRHRAEKRVLSAEADTEMEALRRQVAEAQLQTLQAQVEPHFLFNTLAAVEHLTETDPPRAAIMLRHLIAYLRGSLPDMRERNTLLGREVDLCQSYLAIMQIRMEDRLSVSIDVPEALRGLSFPPMMLQSLVENSIKHGLEPKPEGGAIAIAARLQGGRLRVTVADTGLGIVENAPQGIGLSNIRDRLKRLYGESAALILAPNAPAGAHITIEIPHVPTPASDTGG